MKPALRVLVVEDYEPFRKALCLSLRRRTEYQVIEASDGLEAVEKAKELQPDLVLLDIGLPKLNGIESARQVQKVVPGVKLLFVIQESSSEVIEEAFRLGAQGYVRKQDVRTDLFPAIDAVLCGRRFLGGGLEEGERANARAARERLIQVPDASDLRVQAAIRESEERFRLVTNTAPVMIWMSGVDKLCTYFNNTWLEFTGRPQEAEMGNGWAEGVHPEDLPHCIQTYSRAFEQREPFQMEYRLRRYDGEYRWIFDSGVPRFDTGGSFAGYIGSAIDVTERKMAETALSMMSQRLLQAQEDERRWIARELHDDISQRLASMALSLSGLKAHAVQPEVQKGIDKAIQDVSDLGRHLRALSHRLHSSNLEYLGLAAAASAYCRERSAEHTVEVDFRSEDIPKDLPQEASLCLFRVLQESLQNAIKHSGSQHFQVALKGGSDDIELTVRDFGVGFDADYARKGRGLGLTSMKERLKLVKGTISIDSQLGRGTTIQVRVPWPRQNLQTNIVSLNQTA